MDFWSTLAGHELAATIKNLSRELTEFNSRSKEEKLAEQIYSQLVARDFYEEDGLGYEALKTKAEEAAKEYYSTTKH